MTTCRVVVLVAAAAAPAWLAPAQPVDLLPDITVTKEHLYDNEIRFSDSHRYLRLSNATPNIGDGKLYLYGVEPGHPDGTQDVMQRVYRSDGSFYDRFAGTFMYHPEHDHIHFEDWAVYRLREQLPEGGVGDIVAQGEKTSFCILDLEIHDASLPNFDPDGQFHTCDSTTQGLSVGWRDIYGKHLPGQAIDITDVPNGRYWLESVVDPEGHLLEMDTSNNVQRIEVIIGNDEGINPDVFEPNNSTTDVALRLPGWPNSPNLGPADPQRVVTDLTIDVPTDVDLFYFYATGTGGPDDFIRIDYDIADADLTLDLLSADGTVLATSSTTEAFEQISLSGRPKGYYFARARAASGDIAAGYSLTVDPPANAPPAITVTAPPAGNVVRRHGTDMYAAQWAASDPEGGPMWVTVYVNHVPEFDGNEILMPVSLNTPANLGFFYINSAEIEHGTYWVYASVTDGGTTTGAWSAGTVTFTDCTVDVNLDGYADTLDFLVFLNYFAAGDHRADFNGDFTVDTQDVLDFLNAFNEGC